MTTCSLILRPYGKPPFSISLLENDGRKSNIEQIITKKINAYIFSDLSYEFTLSGLEMSSIREVDVYINDVYEPSIYNNGCIFFPEKCTSDRRIFMDCYGFVEITLVVYDIDGNEHQYTSEYLSVLVRKGELNDAVKAMVSYVHTNQELLLFNGGFKARSFGDLKESGYQSFSAQIILAEETASIYESNYGYFKANSRFRIDKVSKIDRFEHLQYITPATIQFISTHLEELKQVSGNFGIRIGNRVYQPEKTLSMRNIRSYDTYENRVVLGFIRKMIDSVNELYSHCDSLLQQIPTNEDYNAEYMYSSFFMFVETRKRLEKGLARLKNLRIKFARLWNMFSSIFKIQPEAMLSEPRPSHIFMSVPQYNYIFVQIHKWFRFGIYDFKKESFMLSFIKISSLYEVYLLTKMIAYFQERGYMLENTKKCVYPTKRNWKYKNTNCSNTFIFKNNYHKLTLYYQPVIFDTDESGINGIGVIRNNSIPAFTKENGDYEGGGHYYSPDYLIKVEDNLSVRYLVLDAKFSDFLCVRRYYVKESAFKYLFSMSPIRSTESIVGLGLIYGKCDESEQMQSVYDKRLPGQQIAPVVELLPLVEGVANEEHYSKLDALMWTVIA